YDAFEFIICGTVFIFFAVFLCVGIGSVMEISVLVVWIVLSLLEVGVLFFVVLMRVVCLALLSGRGLVFLLGFLFWFLLIFWSFCSGLFYFGLLLGFCFLRNRGCFFFFCSIYPLSFTFLKRDFRCGIFIFFLCGIVSLMV